MQDLKFLKKQRKMKILKQSHSAGKLEKVDPLGFLKLQFAAKYQKKLEGETLWRQKNRKSPIVPKKIQRWGTL